ncbi:U1 small nuclear ribonucleoprotein A [Hondaea fermentalgiana]|uniref:U1 small nuclear ribonucleoprotein A n=1 Tax=Hondaea fermentalgiana TaxID=2315210 RepID=A0A2R5GW85_9STRA|nr:U1 small nuclear ribonucleoprotein A [Hondaea fermentalgiana]|eukprot:GBG34589.1 U1 small nuclear ribonucleoprotein A [Hondaea fermentalgiana]
METPSHTLYLRGLEEKVHPDRIKLMLYTAFSRYGTILDIVCSRRNKLRGQAWIIFKEVLQATEAKKAMTGATMYGKEIRIEYAKTKSDVIARLDGTFKPRVKRKPEDGATQGPKRPDAAPAKMIKSDTNGSQEPTSAAESGSVPMDTSEGPINPAQPEVEAPPHKVLFLQNLPSEASKEALEILFKQFPGLEGVRYFAAKNVAFVDFDSVENAKLAKDGSQGFKLTATHEVHAAFAKQ